MKLGTKVGWILIAVAIVFTVWIVSVDRNVANQTTDDGFTLNDSGTELISYEGNGGSITIPSGVTSIDSGVFANQTNITSVSMPDTVTDIGTGLFSGCTGLSSVSLSGNISTLPGSTFSGCTSLSSVTIPSAVRTIGSKCFSGCTGISSISIPSGARSVDSSAFDGCKNLHTIQVSGGNSNYSSYDGCLYNSNGTNLIRCPENKATITLSGKCTSIGSGALKDCTSIDNITIPAEVNSISGDSFSGSGLQTIYGYSDSTAENYAGTYGYSFIQLDNVDDGTVSPTSAASDTDDEEDEEVVDEDDDDEDDSSSTKKKKKKNTDTGSTDGSGSGSGSSGSGSGGSGGGSGSGGSTSGGPSGSGGHNKDTTPKTADGDIDPRFMFSLALLLAGGAFIAVSRRKKYDYINTHRR